MVPRIPNKCHIKDAYSYLAVAIATIASYITIELDKYRMNLTLNPGAITIIRLYK